MRHFTKYTIGVIALAVLAIIAALSVSGQSPSLSNVASINNIRNAGYCADTSVSANTITCSTAVGFTGYSAGQALDVLLANTITGAATINVNALGAKAVTYNGSTALVQGNNLLVGGVFRFIYDGTRFQFTGPVTFVPAAGGSWAGVTGCVVYRSTADYILSCDNTLTYGSGNLIITNSSAPLLTLKNSGANQPASVEIQNASGRQWLFGTGVPGATNTGLAYTNYTNGSFNWVQFYLKKDGSTCVGKGNTECTASTESVKDATATTGATRHLIQLGAADTLNTYTDVNSGSGSVAGNVRTIPIATASLVACVAGTAGARAAVNDALAPAIGVALTGGGAIFATVHCSATTTSWIVDGL